LKKHEKGIKWKKKQKNEKFRTVGLEAQAHVPKPANLFFFFFLKKRQMPLFKKKKQTNDMPLAMADYVSYTNLEFSHHYGGWKIGSTSFLQKKKKKHDFQPHNTLRTPLEPIYQPTKPKK